MHQNTFFSFSLKNAVTFEKRVLAGEFSYVLLLIRRHSFQKEVLGSRTALAPLVRTEATRRGNMEIHGESVDYQPGTESLRTRTRVSSSSVSPFSFPSFLWQVFKAQNSEIRLLFFLLKGTIATAA